MSGEQAPFAFTGKINKITTIDRRRRRRKRRDAPSGAAQRQGE